ncbi:hypothetical protein DLAC_06444 [Tieghemostelium lacteum]|uniref:DSCP-N domain-containing protein n=1 Tax=Tieghemostelium lacteum TaxID=361077 RepID=A0A151ZES1_TIELA|nr:hypothetical protein DLAC_06444 [Tieghemostelium lacteum]|eukprot:KYQ92462.1 hypothetical protein DLAC_06444 [Tieghemostelium lacteum]
MKNSLLSLFIITILSALLFNINASPCEYVVEVDCDVTYPICRTLHLNSCCGSSSLCVSGNMDVTIDRADRVLGKLYCIRDPRDNQVYHLNTHNISNYQFEFYQVFEPPNLTCESIGCHEKNLLCEYYVDSCLNDSPCCRPIPRCVEIRQQDTTLSKSNGMCSKQCPKGFICRFLVKEEHCLPETCENIICPEGMKCQEVFGTGVSSCFPNLLVDEMDIITDEDDNCDTKECTSEFTCGDGIFSQADCIPNNVEYYANRFECSKCPKNWYCNKFGLSGICVEWNSENRQCSWGEMCDHFQICNETTKSCYYDECNNSQSSPTCSNGLVCFQSSPQNPKICASEFIMPYTRYSGPRNTL